MALLFVNELLLKSSLTIVAGNNSISSPPSQKKRATSLKQAALDDEWTDASASYALHVHTCSSYRRQQRAKERERETRGREKERDDDEEKESRATTASAPAAEAPSFLILTNAVCVTLSARRATGRLLLPVLSRICPRTYCPLPHVAVRCCPVAIVAAERVYMCVYVCVYVCLFIEFLLLVGRHRVTISNLFAITDATIVEHRLFSSFRMERVKLCMSHSLF